MKQQRQRRWQVKLNEHQLNLIAQCVEDICRFMTGQTELMNTICRLPNYNELAVELSAVKEHVAPDRISHGATYGWNGGTCANPAQKKFIAETYYLYRSIYEAIAKERAKTEDMSWNVYLSDTLRCELSGEPIKIERIDHGRND